MKNNKVTHIDEALLTHDSERGYQFREEVIKKHKEIMAGKTEEEREAWAVEMFGPEGLTNPIWRHLAGLSPLGAGV